MGCTVWTSVQSYPIVVGENQFHFISVDCLGLALSLYVPSQVQGSIIYFLVKIPAFLLARRQSEQIIG